MCHCHACDIEQLEPMQHAHPALELAMQDLVPECCRDMTAVFGAATCTSAWERDIDEALLELERQVQEDARVEAALLELKSDFERWRALHELEEAAPWSCKRRRFSWLSATSSSHRARADPADVRCQEPAVRCGSSSCAIELPKAVDLECGSMVLLLAKAALAATAGA